MTKLHHLSSLILNRPLLCTPGYAETVLAVLGERVGVDAADLNIGGSRARDAGVTVTSDGVAVIPVIGSISHREMGLDAVSGLTSYASTQRKISAALDDDSVRSILLDMDSPGGTVAGAFDFADWLMEQRGRKPMASVSRDTMCSAAYLIGSCADEVYATQTGTLGSIGVVYVHMDKSAKMENDGIKPTILQAGDHKADGNPFEPLAADVKAEMMAEINDAYELFVNAVVARRELSVDAVRATEARVYSGQKAVEVGLADKVGTFDMALTELQAMPRSYPSTSLKGQNMDKDEILAEGAAQERTRISAILGSDEAKGRAGLASHFAMNTSMDVDAAKAALAASPLEAVAPADDSEEVAALKAENEALREANKSKRDAALENLADETVDPGEGQGSMNSDTPAADPKAARIAEAKANARMALGPRARTLA